MQNELCWSARADRYALTSIVTAFTAVLKLVIETGILCLYFGMIHGGACGVAIAMHSLPYLLQFCLNPAELARMLRFSVPLAISSVSIILGTTVNRLLLPQNLNFEVLGVYGVATRVAAIAMLGFQGFQLAVLLATVGQGQTVKREVQLGRSFRLSLLIAISVALILSAASQWLLSRLAVPAYETPQA